MPGKRQFPGKSEMPKLTGNAIVGTSSELDWVVCSFVRYAPSRELQEGLRVLITHKSDIRTAYDQVVLTNFLEASYAYFKKKIVAHSSDDK
jgi:hypothetical protein